MKILSKTKEKLVFVDELNESLANTLRRSASEIDILAVDEVEFYKNDSVLNDQMLAHRIGLIPLKNEKLTRREECTCKGEGCAKCTVQLKLSAKGPTTVYSKELKGKADAIYGEMPIVLLDKDQELEFVAHAKLGKGIEHAKFSPGLVFYRPAYEVDATKSKDILEKYKNQITIIEKTGATTLVDLPEGCLHEIEVAGHKAERSTHLVFIIESFGQIEAKEILLESIQVLRENLQQISKEQDI